MLKNYESTLFTLRDKLKEEESRTLIVVINITKKGRIIKT